MCGIAGVFNCFDSQKQNASDVLELMSKRISHRGPDGEGFYVDGPCGLVHRRLAIIDLSQRGKQPMVDQSTGVAITYNGEIYNFLSIRSELISCGQDFVSQTDTEVILRGYLTWGKAIVDKLSGIFSFAIWDPRQRELLLARDHFGIKPLFYSVDERSFRFSSEIPSLLADPTVSREIDDGSVDAFLTFGYTAAPNTGFKAIKQLPPAHYAIVSNRGVDIRQYWEVPYAEQPLSIGYKDAVCEFRSRFHSVVKSQLMSDVPVGMFLSGGIDSAAVLEGITASGHSKVMALTVGFSNKAYDETRAATATAQALGAAHRIIELNFKPHDLVHLLSRHFAEPTADSSMFAVYLVSREARNHFTVALTGDGADEYLAGYETYQASAYANYYRMLPRVLRKEFAKRLLQVVPVSDKKYSAYKKLSRFSYGAELGPLRDHSAWRIIFTDLLKAKCYVPEFYARSMRWDPLNDYCKAASIVPPSRSYLSKLLHCDLKYYLPGDMLTKVDRCSMAVGLEARVPFLDKDLISFVCNLPDQFKLGSFGGKKRILRDSLRERIPDSVIKLPKSGFNVPLEQWMRTELRDLYFDVLYSRKHDLERFLNISSLEHLWYQHFNREADHAHLLFAVLMFGLWFHNLQYEWLPIGSDSYVGEEKRNAIGLK